MLKQAGRPRQPMGEAWFMGGDRRLFTSLFAADLAVLDTQELAQALAEIASGNASFGPREEWRQWFLYLLPRLVPIALQDGQRELQELLTTALMAEHPRGLDDDAVYPGFRRDVLHTLGRAIMDPGQWQEGQAVLGRVLHPAPGPDGGCWWHASADLSCSLFLALKYLQPQEIDAWATSVFAIDDVHWRAQLLVWLVGAYPLLATPGQQPCDKVRGRPDVGWSSSHVLGGHFTGDFTPPIERVPFLPAANQAVFKGCLREQLTVAVLEGWLDAIWQVEGLAVAVGTVVSTPRAILGLWEET